MEDVIYLDYNASTPCDPRVIEAMLPFFSQVFANPSSRGHGPGRQAVEALEAGRASLARCLGADFPTEIVFTSGATEANNLALRGTAARLVDRGRHIITQASEHPSVLEPLRHLAGEGWEVEVIGVAGDGRLRLDELQRALRSDTVLVTVMLANNETGTLQPVRAVTDMARQAGAVVHCDAAQAVGKVALDVTELDVDLLSLSGHKIYGPKGIGALYVRRRRPPLLPLPILHGGGQEGGLRSGTVNLPGVVGLARALELARDGMESESMRVATLRDRLEGRVLERLEGATCNGARDRRLPGTSSLSFAGIEGAALLAAIPDLAVGTGSACSSTERAPSHVLLAMGLGRELAAATLRLSLGRFTTETEVDRAAERIADEVTRLRGMRRR